MSDIIDSFSLVDDVLARMPPRKGGKNLNAILQRATEDILEAVDADLHSALEAAITNEINHRLETPPPIDIDGKWEDVAEQLSAMGCIDRMAWLRGFLDRLSPDAILDLDAEMVRR